MTRAGTDEPAEDWWAESARWTDSALERRAPSESEGVPPRLAEAVRYALLGGGKRLRPSLVRLFARASGAGDAAAEGPAAAVEMVHTYSLVHDDLPCMDDDELRRGRPTCHVVYGEALAVLAGDALLTRAFELLGAEPRGGAMTAALARAAGAAGMVGGQVLDLSLVGSDCDRAEVARVHAMKTAALIAAACELGALAADAPEHAVGAARAYGEALGRLFQVVDDLLDVTGAADVLGKTPGKDAVLDRATMVAALGLDGARAEARRLADDARAATEALGERERRLALGLVDRVLGRES